MRPPRLHEGNLACPVVRRQGLIKGIRSQAETRVASCTRLRCRGERRKFRLTSTMLFDSPIYLVFLAVAVLVYWRLSHRAQSIFLLVASYIFYGWWDWHFLGLMIASTTVDFFIAQRISPMAPTRNRKWWLGCSLVWNFTILGVFKYYDFFAGSLVGALDQLGIHNLPLPLIRIILPPGISFYTFEEVAYIVDVYQGKVQPASSYLNYALFISFFPHLIAGPIQRPHQLLPQIQN